MTRKFWTVFLAMYLACVALTLLTNVRVVYMDVIEGVLAVAAAIALVIDR